MHKTLFCNRFPLLISPSVSHNHNASSFFGMIFFRYFFEFFSVVCRKLKTLLFHHFFNSRFSCWNFCSFIVYFEIFLWFLLLLFLWVMMELPFVAFRIKLIIKCLPHAKWRKTLKSRLVVQEPTEEKKEAKTMISYAVLSKQAYWRHVVTGT